VIDNRLFIRDEGEGRPLVLIHGWSCPGQFFEGQVEALKESARCIVPDLPGHGKTGDRLSLTIEAAADALSAFLESENLTDAVLCGWSLGAHVAYAMVERQGTDRIAEVVSIDMSPKIVNDDEWPNGTLNGLTAATNEHVLNAIVPEWPKLPGGIARRLFASGLPMNQELLEFASAQIAECDPVLLKPMWASLATQDFRELLKAFPLPLHLAFGTHSQLYGSGVRQWHKENVPEFHLHEFEASGHSPHLEEPEKFNKLLLELVQA